jgi:hypothetical protein
MPCGDTVIAQHSAGSVIVCDDISMPNITLVPRKHMENKQAQPEEPRPTF